MTIDEIVGRLTRLSGVRAAALCSYDGIIIVARRAAGAPGDDRIAAMAAEIGRAASALLQGLESDRLRLAVFDGSAGKLALADAGRGYLAAVTDHSANVGLLRLEIERAAQDMRDVLSVPAAEGQAV